MVADGRTRPLLRQALSPAPGTARPRTPAHAKALLPILQAYAEGKTIEHRSGPPDADGEWTWQRYTSGLTFDDDPSRYRIRPGPPPPPQGSTDATAWALSFVEHVGHLPGIACDVATMVGWFANAMEAAAAAVQRPDLRFGFEHEDELPDPVFTGVDMKTSIAKKDAVFGCMYAASQLGYDGKGGTRVYPYVERDGQRYYLIKLKDT